MTNTPDFDDPAIAEAWATMQRPAVLNYLARQRVPDVVLEKEPAWLVAPYIAVWEVRGQRSGSVTYWAISGDLPTDFVPADTLPDPRSAVAAFAKRWLDVAAYMRRGERHPTVHIGPPGESAALGPLLESRAAFLSQLTTNDENW